MSYFSYSNPGSADISFQISDTFWMVIGVAVVGIVTAVAWVASTYICQNKETERSKAKEETERSRLREETERSRLQELLAERSQPLALESPPENNYYMKFGLL